RALWLRGSLAAVGAPCVAIVGSRRASAYGLDVAGRFGADLAQSGLTIVSGAARGIDAAAHRGALRVGGPTVAVVGSGLGVPYPPENAGLLNAIVEAGGCVMTELPCDAEPLAHHFPRRNRILAGLCVGVVVVEAGLSSGAMITARLAADGQQREVMAVPGRVDSAGAAGCHRMIREGWATLVTSSNEVIQALGGAPGLLAACRRGPPPSSLRPELADAVSRIQAAESDAGAALDPDRLCSLTGLKAGLVLAALSFRETWSAGPRQG
ncbi:MAG: DNA-protecting protein DprA, partial [Phycisphaerae bacterium]|nr:DNA-protecting protein DprA [Phycisphaerae bacterium]